MTEVGGKRFLVPKVLQVQPWGAEGLTAPQREDVTKQRPDTFQLSCCCCLIGKWLSYPMQLGKARTTSSPADLCSFLVHEECHAPSRWLKLIQWKIQYGQFLLFLSRVCNVWCHLSVPGVSSGRSVLEWVRTPFVDWNCFPCSSQSHTWAPGLCIVTALSPAPWEGQGTFLLSMSSLPIPSLLPHLPVLSN